MTELADRNRFVTGVRPVLDGLKEGAEAMAIPLASDADEALVELGAEADREPAELIDAHWLFAEYLGTAARPSAPLVCRLPSGDPWMQNMLRPIIEAAGYIVIGDGHDLIPDLVIRSDGQAKSESGSARVLTLATDPEAADGIEKIYRYDRAGLMMALKSAGAGRGK